MKKIKWLLPLTIIAITGCRAPLYQRSEYDAAGHLSSTFRVSARSLFSAGAASRIELVDGDKRLIVEGLSGKGDPETLKVFLEGAGQAAAMGVSGGASSALPVIKDVLSKDTGTKQRMSIAPPTSSQFAPAVILPRAAPLETTLDLLEEVIPDMNILDTKQAVFFRLERSTNMLSWYPASEPGWIGDIIPLSSTNMFWRLVPAQ